MPTTASASSSNNLEILAQKKECVAALRVAYPEVNAAPQETQELIEKMDKDIERLEKENSKFVTKNLHAATKTLGKAQKTLTEALESKKVHRTRWIKHITEVVTTWQTQLQEYQKQQETFQIAATKARADIETARKEIQALSVKASQATLAAMPPLTALTAEQDEGNTDADTEEEKLQGQLQSVLQHCAAVLNAETPHQVNDEAEDLTMEDEERDEKRPRSMQPFGVPGSAGVPSDAKNA
jgi:myosin heavy subunit